MYINNEVYIQNLMDNNRYDLFINHTINYCTFLSKMNTESAMLKYLFDIAMQFGKIPQSCPIKQVITDSMLSIIIFIDHQIDFKKIGNLLSRKL